MRLSLGAPAWRRVRAKSSVDRCGLTPRCHTARPTIAFMRQTDFSDLSRQSDVFGHLGDEALADLRGCLVWFSLPGGRPLFKAGETADAMYLLVSGSLRLFDEDDPARLVHLVSAGDSVGEIGLVSGETPPRNQCAPRSHSYTRAVRRS